MNAADLTTKINACVKNLAEATSAAYASEIMQAYLQTVSKFYSYSWGNQLLIMFANPQATRVAGYKRWLDFHRYVRKGEHGIPILAPLITKHETDDGAVTSSLHGFRIAYVFDVSQTDGEPLPEEPNWKSPARQAELEARLLQFAASKGITVTVEDLGRAQGKSTGGAITLDPTAGVKTLIHELAHELLHHAGDHTNHTDREIEAEATAYVVAEHFGVPDLASPNYLALCAAAPDRIIARLSTIRSTALEIIQAVDPSEP